MGWMQKLLHTYEQCAGTAVEPGTQLWPLSHIVKRAHIEVIISNDGDFLGCRLLGRSESPTLIPATEASAGRTSNAVAHPLCEEIGYCASDYPNSDKEKVKRYESLLSQWADSKYSHPKVKSILKYFKQGRIWSDLSKMQIFPVKIEDGSGKKIKIADNKVFLRWRIEATDSPCSGTWEDKDLISAWIEFDKAQTQQSGFCMLTGEQTRLTQNHPRFIRYSSDGAKLISANDFSGYTFRGRFTDKKDDYQNQPCSVGYEASQKAHNALRWLINRQGYRNGDKVFVSWEIAGRPVPNLFLDSLSFIISSERELDLPTDNSSFDPGDVGQVFAKQLNRAISGYRAILDPVNIVVMGLDSATPGRMAIIFYRELKGSEFLDCIEQWHTHYAWPQNFGKDAHFVGAPAPRDIAEAAYGRRIDDKLRNAAVERLLPCIIDAQPFPSDIMRSIFHRVFNRVGLDRWEWEKCLGIGCAIYRGYYLSQQQKRYSMSLETNRTTRDYLYGRLLAVADNIENYALTRAEKNRDTSAAKLMQRFANRPFSTWRTIELALSPYKSRLRSTEKGAGFLYKRENLLDEILCAFNSDDFTDDARPLSGEFLLGFHCQRQKLLEKAERSTDADPGNSNDDDSSDNDSSDNDSSDNQ